MLRLLPLLLCLSFFFLGFDPDAQAQLRADFTADHTGGCSPLVVHFNASVFGAPFSTAGYTYEWDLGNGNTATVASPEAIYSTIGTYTITLTVSNGSATASATHTVTVYPAPTVSFSASSSVVCGSPVQLTGEPAGSIVGWLWDFGDGSTSNGGPATSHQYAVGGPVNASLTVTDDHGCTATLAKTDLAVVYGPLTAGFTADKSVLCLVSDPVQFTNVSNGPGTLSYSWDFGDGSTSTAVSPNHIYPAAGSYNVHLNVTSSVGCSATFAQPAAMNVANYTTDFSISNPTVCVNTPITFTDLSTPQPTTRIWTVDGVGVSNYTPLSESFSIAGTHTITLANTFGTCPQQVTKTVTVNPVPPYIPFSLSAQLNCGGYSVTVIDLSSTNYTRAWDPAYSAGAPAIAFVPGNATMTFPNYYYVIPYTVALQLTNSFGCSTLITEPITEYQNTPSIYEPNPGPAASCNTPITKTFAYNFGGTLTSFYWDFGDGTTSTSPNPTHTWTQPGSYATTLHYVDGNGCAGQTNPLMSVISTPFSLNFSGSPTTVCTGSTVTFSSNLASTGASIYSWNFGDGTGISINSYHTYNTPGIYTVTLSATNPGGCSASATQTNYITVIAPPGAYQGHTNTCDGNRNVVTFDYSSTNATSLTWDFGDGQTVVTNGSVTQQQHTYAKTGTYYINLSVSNGTCSAQNSDVINVLTKQQPVLSASSNSVCVTGSLNVQLAIARNPAEINSGYYYDYTPQFFYADGKPFAGLVNFTTSQPYLNGAFNWTLSGFQPGETGLYVVTTSFAFGCTDQSNTIPLSIKGSATPGLTIISDGHCYQQPVMLQDVSSVGTGNAILSGLWSFGDGQTQALVVGGQVSHTYSNPGSYTVQLTINDAGGCQTSSGAGIGGVTVYGPKAAFTPSASTMLFGSTLYLYNYTNTSGAGTVTYGWDLGDGTTSTAINPPSHVYAAPGTYTVRLTASSPTGCTSSAQATIVVQPYNSHFQTAASYVTGGKCPPVLAQFSNTSYGYSSISWDFGDGTTAGNVNYPSHVYAAPGTYTVTLSCFNGGILQAQYTDVVNVRQPSASLATSTPAVCLGSSALLQATASGALGYLFDFGDGSVSLNGDASTGHVYTSPGTYDAALVVTDTVGCAVAAVSPVSVQVNPLPTVAVTPSLPVACLNSSVSLSASGAATYSWSPATGLDQPNGSSPVASPLVTTTYQVTGVDNNGCTAVSNVTVKVVQPQQVAVSPDSTVVCYGDTVSLYAKGTDVYAWILDTSGLSSLVVGDPSARPPASLRYTVVGSDVYQCFHDTASIAVTVLPVPTVDGGPDVEVLAGTPVTLLATGSTDVVSWLWTPPDFLNCTECSQPVCTPKKPTTYTVKVTNEVGCHAYDTVQVKLLCIEARVRIPEAFSPNGDGRNDRFDILGIGEVEHLVIFDRWGEKVFERSHFYTADLGSQWDGTVHGQPAPTGTYVYFAEMNCPSGGEFMRKGTVVLVR